MRARRGPTLPCGPRPSLDGSALGRALAASGLTKSELARRAGVSPSIIFQAIAGDVVGIRGVPRLATVLGVPPNSLITIQ